MMTLTTTCKPASVAKLDTRSTGERKVAGLTPPGRQHSFLEI